MNPEIFRRINFYESVTQDDWFFGQDNARKMLREFFAHRTGLPAILMGERRTSKTSTLYWAGREFSKLPESAFAYIDLSTYLDLLSNPDGVLAINIYRHILATLGAVDPDLDHLSPAHFGAQALADSLRRLFVSYPGKRVLLALDEFDVMFAEHTRNRTDRNALVEVINTLLDAANHPSDPLPLQIVLALTRIPSSLRHVEQRFEQRMLPLSEDKTREMVEKTMAGPLTTLASSDLHRLQELSGGWPYFIKFLMLSAYYEDLPLTLGWPQRAFDVVKHPTQEEILSANDHLNESVSTIYRNAGGDEEQAMLGVIGMLGELSLEHANQISSRLQGALSSLVQRGLLVRSAKMGYRFQIELLAFWVKSEWHRLRVKYYDKYQALLPSEVAELVIAAESNLSTRITLHS
jgi:hypothetical protein